MSSKDFLDVRGLSCPEPVLRTKRLIDQGLQRELTIVTDSRVAVENIKRLVSAFDLTFSYSEEDHEFIIKLLFSPR